MSDPSDKKGCQNKATESQTNRKLGTMIQGLTSTATTYISKFIGFVKGLLTDKQVSADDLQNRIDKDLKELIYKTEEKVKEVYEKIIKEVKILQENELRNCKHYSKEELAKAEIKFNEYSVRIQEILGDVIKRLQTLKNQLQTKIMTHKEILNLIMYFGEKLDQTKQLTQEMVKNIQETIKDPELKKKCIAMIENHWKKVQNATDTLFTFIKAQAYADRESKCVKSELRNGKTLKLIATSYIVRVIAYMKGLLSGKKPSGDQNMALISQDIKNLLTLTELRVKELYDGILKKVKDIQDNELQTYQNYSKEELTKVKLNLQDYSVKVRKLSDDMVKHISTLKNELQKRLTQKDFQSFVSYFEMKMIETKKLTEDLIKNIREIMKDPTLGKKLKAITESNSRKIKIAVDDLYAAIKSNVVKIGRFKPLTDTKMAFLKMSTFSKMRSLNDSSQTLPGNDNEAATNSKGNRTVGLNKAKLPLFNLSKHFNSRTDYGRANVAKATYAGILIYYIYRKVKNSST